MDPIQHTSACCIVTSITHGLKTQGSWIGCEYLCATINDIIIMKLSVKVTMQVAHHRIASTASQCAGKRFKRSVMAHLDAIALRDATQNKNSGALRRLGQFARGHRLRCKIIIVIVSKDARHLDDLGLSDAFCVPPSPSTTTVYCFH